MALFDGKGDKDAGATPSQEAGQAGDQDYFDQFAGEGLDTLTQDALATAYLAMVQPGSTAAATQEPGTWRNTATGDNLGPTVRVIPLAFKTVWTERSKDPPYLTVGRYEPKSIEVDVEYPKPGTRGFPKMTNPRSGNKVEELFIYACLLADAPDAGILYFSPTVGSMRACKSWNSQLRSQRLPSGKLAPIYAFSWDLTLDLVQNPARPNNPNEKITKFVTVMRAEIVAKDLFFKAVQPQIAAAANVAMLAAPEHSGDAEEA